MVIKIDYKKCCWKDGGCLGSECGCNCGCHGCVENCPVGAIKRGKKVEVDNSKCISCGMCVSSCLYGAISLSNV